jgi:enterochelin esterase family protein
MKMLKFFILFLVLPQSLFSESFKQFIQHLNLLPLNERQVVVDSFMNVNYSFPFIESDTVVHFIYQVPAQRVSIKSDTVIHVISQGPNHRISVAGDFTGWMPTLDMTNIGGTNFWYADAFFESNARLDYKIVINGKEWILDPKNPLTCTGGFGPNSELRMPGYMLPAGLTYDKTIPHGTIHDTVIYSQTLANRRAVQVYLPPDYGKVRKKYPVILFHDGPDYINLGQVNNLMDWLIWHHEIEPVIGIFLPPVEREAEYAGKKVKALTCFIIYELMPLMEEKYTISKDPHKRATLGASLGGNISLYLGIAHPECFGKIAAQSSFVSKKVSGLYRNGKKQDIFLYLDLGKYDLCDLIPMVHDFIPVLKFKKYNYRFYEFPEGHSWGNWKAHLNLALTQFFPYE